MLKVGTKIICGGKRAKEYSYSPCVGREGEILIGPQTTASGIIYYSVNFEGKYGSWGILEEDCVPCQPKTNREALSHLESEY